MDFLVPDSPRPRNGPVVNRALRDNLASLRYASGMTDARFAAALSIRHDGTLAMREAADALLDGLGGRSPDLLVIFLSNRHNSEYEQVAQRLGSLTRARVLIGCCAESVIGGGREVERSPALSLWGVACEGLALHPFRVQAHANEEWEAELAGGEQIAYSGHPEFGSLEPGPSDSLLLFGDPYSFPMSDYLEKLHRESPGLLATGGMASGGQAPGESALFLGGKHLNSGAVGVRLQGGIELTNVISQAYRPVGTPWVITDCKGSLVTRLGGKSASKVMMETIAELSPKERTLLQSGPMLGVAWDATQGDFDASDFLAHPIRGFAPQEQAIVIVGEVRRGQTVQFMIRDPRTAGTDLDKRLERHAGPSISGPGHSGALLFTCNARGSRMFNEPDHDVKRVERHLGDGVPIAGFFAQGEIGHIGDRCQLHGFTASTAIYRASQS
ncbi:MAG: small ligand-binding sensory domain FIST [Candidatus Paceibacteria bacterium]|jgi:small ligand-binding sensory domain FIST